MGKTVRLSKAASLDLYRKPEKGGRLCRKAHNIAEEKWLFKFTKGHCKNMFPTAPFLYAFVFFNIKERPDRPSEMSKQNAKHPDEIRMQTQFHET